MVIKIYREREKVERFFVWFGLEREKEIVKSSARTLDSPIKRVWDVDRLFLLLSSQFFLKL